MVNGGEHTFVEQKAVKPTIGRLILSINLAFIVDCAHLGLKRIWKIERGNNAVMLEKPVSATRWICVVTGNIAVFVQTKTNCRCRAGTSMVEKVPSGSAT